MERKGDEPKGPFLEASTFLLDGRQFIFVLEKLKRKEVHFREIEQFFSKMVLPDVGFRFARLQSCLLEEASSVF